MSTSNITRQRIATNQRVSHTVRLFGLNFPMRLEPAIFSIAGSLAAEYDGGYWEFYKISNGGFYMAPVSEQQFSVSADNGFEGSMSGDALGITACLYAYSHLSFGDGAFAEICAEQYHLLREFALDHAEVGSIMQAID
ncbi:MAG: antirestriction protein [Gallionellaceae bacterium]|jgi:hypothetical protein